MSDRRVRAQRQSHMAPERNPKSDRQETYVIARIDEVVIPDDAPDPTPNRAARRAARRRKR
ncbi:hypothetical protein [Streptomyces sp. 900116325]